MFYKRYRRKQDKLEVDRPNPFLAATDFGRVWLLTPCVPRPYCLAHD
jgi:hypothetical protein